MSTTVVERVGLEESSRPGGAASNPLDLLKVDTNVDSQKYFQTLGRFYQAVNGQYSQLEAHRRDLYLFTLRSIFYYRKRTGETSFEHCPVNSIAAKKIAVVFEKAFSEFQQENHKLTQIYVSFSPSQREVDRIEQTLKSEFYPAWVSHCEDVKVEYDKKRRELFSQLKTGCFIVFIKQ